MLRLLQTGSGLSAGDAAMMLGRGNVQRLLCLKLGPPDSLDARGNPPWPAGHNGQLGSLIVRNVEDYFRCCVG